MTYRAFLEDINETEDSGESLRIFEKLFDLNNLNAANKRVRTPEGMIDVLVAAHDKCSKEKSRFFRRPDQDRADAEKWVKESVKSLGLNDDDSDLDGEEEEEEAASEEAASEEAASEEAASEEEEAASEEEEAASEEEEEAASALRVTHRIQEMPPGFEPLRRGPDIVIFATRHDHARKVTAADRAASAAARKHKCEVVHDTLWLRKSTRTFLRYKGPVEISTESALELRAMEFFAFNGWVEFKCPHKVTKLTQARYKVSFHTKSDNAREYTRHRISAVQGQYNLGFGMKAHALRNTQRWVAADGTEELMLLPVLRLPEEVGVTVDSTGAAGSKGGACLGQAVVHPRGPDGPPDLGGCVWKVLLWLGLDVVPVSARQPYMDFIKEALPLLQKAHYVATKVLTCDADYAKAVEEGQRQLLYMAKMLPTPLVVLCHGSSHAVGIADNKIFDPELPAPVPLGMAALREYAPRLSRAYRISRTSTPNNNKKKRKRRKATQRASQRAKKEPHMYSM